MVVFVEFELFHAFFSIKFPYASNLSLFDVQFKLYWNFVKVL